MSELVIRTVRPLDLAACLHVENSSFPPAQAAPAERISARLEIFPQGFFVAELGSQVVGHANGGVTDQDDISGEELKQMIGHDPQGRNLILFSLAVLPEYRNRGIASALLARYVQAGKNLGKSTILLLCRKELRGFYQRQGFVDFGESACRFAGAIWREMRLAL